MGSNCIPFISPHLLIPHTCGDSKWTTRARFFVFHPWARFSWTEISWAELKLTDFVLFLFLCELSSPWASSWSYCAREQGRKLSHVTETELFKKSNCYNKPVIWNNLPTQIRCITELDEFKSQIKRYYIRMFLSDYNYYTITYW